ncbi:DUF547 domain-containing protein [Marinicellulosiphila megalodicopiae]|uniref:DUF547 domain-containing protein n=1 Tax=Marinicellulosiphila megalodicopiae TaxID=2724896 RepID=UPI003BB16F85
MRSVTLLLSLLLFTSLSIAKFDFEFWQTHDQTSKKMVDHSSWQALLDQYLNSEDPSGINRFNYSMVSKKDKQSLEKYINYLQTIQPATLNQNEQFSYWINTYNAVTVNLILDKYPVDSIKEIRFLTSPFGPWDKNIIKVSGEKLSLNDIEHNILRPKFKDPRIHFAVNCASLGCPNLQPIAFTASNIETLLEQSAHEFMNHPRGVLVQNNQITLSKIFEWYADDFGQNEPDVLNYVAQYYAKPELLKNGSSVQYKYDWDLNQ